MSHCPVLTGERLATPPDTGLGGWWAFQEIMGNHITVEVHSFAAQACGPLLQTLLLSRKLYG